MFDAVGARVPPRRTLALLVVRRTLGVSAFVSLFYVAAYYLWDQPFPTPLDLAVIFLLVLAGTLLGVAFSRAWPLPAERGLPRVIRTVLLAVPALGIGIALQVLLAGAVADRAYYVVFGLSAWLGSTFIREGEREPGTEAGVETEGDAEAETEAGTDRSDA
ncbi:hypothetical protein [Halomarina pelagica]|uniref:hypothetical protein n=1 Tax=Halomarina pelagica TaxID=2961599 RepID=UPI0020C4512B|nr:hypothetical protein [Halomarina sp. BND7]